jgi:hypothetical protein
MMLDLDIRPDLHAVRLGKKWTDVAGYDPEDDNWQPGRVMAHMVNASTLRQLEPKRPARRMPLIPLAAKLWCIPPLAAASAALAYQLLRRGLL